MYLVVPSFLFCRTPKGAWPSTALLFWRWPSTATPRPPVESLAVAVRLCADWSCPLQLSLPTQASAALPAQRTALAVPLAARCRNAPRVSPSPCLHRTSFRWFLFVHFWISLFGSATGGGVAGPGVGRLRRDLDPRGTRRPRLRHAGRRPSSAVDPRQSHATRLGLRTGTLRSASRADFSGFRCTVLSGWAYFYRVFADRVWFAGAGVGQPRQPAGDALRRLRLGRPAGAALRCALHATVDQSALPGGHRPRPLAPPRPGPPRPRRRGPPPVERVRSLFFVLRRLPSFTKSYRVVCCCGQCGAPVARVRPVSGFGRRRGRRARPPDAHRRRQPDDRPHRTGQPRRGLRQGDPWSYPGTLPSPSPPLHSLPFRSVVLHCFFTC